jgi:hypothetical protein
MSRRMNLHWALGHAPMTRDIHCRAELKLWRGAQWPTENALRIAGRLGVTGGHRGLASLQHGRWDWPWTLVAIC